MIIKSQRVASTASLKRLCDHVFRGEENDRVFVLQGGERDVRDAWRDARQHGAQNALRHWQLCPAEVATREQAFEALADLAAEYRFGAERATLVEHGKPRVTPGAFDTHWHVLLGEVDPASGRILSSSHDFARHEFLARLLEHRWGHKIVLGRHTKAVLARLRRDGQSAAADALDAAQAVQDGAELPREAFTSPAHQEAKRLGVDLPAMREIVSAVWSACTSLADLIEKLAESGLTLEPGHVAGEWLVKPSIGKAHSLRRITRTKKAVFSARMKELSYAGKDAAGDEDDRPNAARRDRAYPGGDRFTEGVRRDDRKADEGRDEELLGGDDGSAGDAGERHGGDASTDRGTPQNDRGPQVHRVASQGVERQLIVDRIVGCATATFALVERAKAVAKPALETAQAAALDRQEAIQRSAVGKAPSAPDGLALSFAAAEVVSHREATEAIDREVQAINVKIGVLLQAERARKGSLWARWTREPVSAAEIEGLKGRRSVLQARHGCAQQRMLEAIVAETAARRSHEKATAEAAAEQVKARNASKVRLAVISRARRLLEAWQGLACCGLKYLVAMATRVERMRERGWDPGSHVTPP